MTRTAAEIKARIEEVETRDWLGVERQDLLAVLSYEEVKPWLRDDVTEEQWEPSPRDAETIEQRMLDYMDFAWEKANDCRGISAGRSLSHYAAWLWLLGWDDAAEQIMRYDHYGKSRLRAICEAFDWDWRSLDDGKWRNAEDEGGLAPPETVESLRRPPGEAARG